MTVSTSARPPSFRTYAHRLALLVLWSAMAAVLTGCGCNTRGCIDNVLLRLRSAAPDGNLALGQYAVTAADATCTITLDGDGERPNALTACASDSSFPPSLFIFDDPDLRHIDLTVFPADGGSFGPSVPVSIQLDGQVVLDQELPLLRFAARRFYPNGKDCEGSCEEWTHDLVIPEQP